MATAEMPTYADNIKTLGDSIVKLTVLEAKALGDYLEVHHGIKPAAAAVAAPVANTQAQAEKKGRADRVRRRPGGGRANKIKRHQGRPRRHGPGPEGGQGPRRGRPQGGQVGRLQGRRRQAQEGAGGRRGDRQDQVTSPTRGGRERRAGSGEQSAECRGGFRPVRCSLHFALGTADPEPPGRRLIPSLQ